LKSTKVPIPIVEKVTCCVLIYLGYNKPDWKSCTQVMADIKFLDRLQTYDKENVG